MLAGKEPYATRMDDLLQRGQVVGHDLIYGELLVGDIGARSKLLAEYIRYIHVAPVPHQDVVNLVRARRFYGQRLSWIDVHVLAAALVYGAQIYTADVALESHAKKLGVHYE